MPQNLDPYATSTTEAIQSDISKSIPESAKSTLADLTTKYPRIAQYTSDVADIANLIPLL